MQVRTIANEVCLMNCGFDDEHKWFNFASTWKITNLGISSQILGKWARRNGEAFQGLWNQ